MTPQPFGRYWLQEKIGQGGMADIFRATIGPDPTTFAFELAIKRLRSELESDPAQVAQFLTEVEVVCLLRHVNLLEAYEAGVVDGHIYMAMELLWGLDLGRLIETLRRRRLLLPPQMSVYIAMQVLRGLDYVHQAKSAAGAPLDIVHGDVTPSNIYVTFRGEVKLGDFGIAHVRGRRQAGEGLAVNGKLAFIPPEVLGGAAIGPQVDLWSVAGTLYEMLTARPLYEGVDQASLMDPARRPAIIAPHRLIPTVPVGLWPILRRALHPRVGRRYADAAIFYRELKRFSQREALRVDAASLARFVRSGTQLGGAEPQGAAQSDAFAAPGYLAPMDLSPTQRYEIRQRQRRLYTLRWAALPLLLAMATGLGYRLAGRGAASGPAGASLAIAIAPQDPQEAAWEVEVVGDMDRAGRAQFAAAMQRGTGALAEDRPGQAVREFRRALALEPGSAAASLGLGRALLEDRQLAEAERRVASVLAETPQNVRALYLLGRILRAAGQLERAQRALEQCVKLDSDGALGRSARALLNEG